MPKKSKLESEAEQSERFRKDAQKLIADGKLDPDAASAALDNLVKRAKGRANERPPS